MHSGGGGQSYLVGMEYEIQLAHILESFVEGLNENVNQVQNAQFTLGGVHTKNKVESSVVSVDELCVTAPLVAPLNEVTHEI